LARRLGEVRVTRRKADFDRVDLADPPIADQFAREAEMRLRTLPAPGLPDAAVPLDGVAHRPTLAKVV